MNERLFPRDTETLPPIQPGEVVRQTPNFQIVTDYKLGLEGQKSGERFFIEPLTRDGEIMLGKAAKAHNIYNFNLRPHPYNPPGGDVVVPALQADYIPTNASPLLHGDIQIPEPGKGTIPSPDRMEACLAQQAQSNTRYPHTVYTFADNLLSEHRMPNPVTRDLRLLQAIYLDDIPDRIIHSPDDNPYYKVRKGFWIGVVHDLDQGLETEEFTDPTIVERINSFLTTYGSGTGFLYAKHLTTQEDIIALNGLIDKIWKTYGNEGIKIASSEFKN